MRIKNKGVDDYCFLRNIIKAISANESMKSSLISMNLKLKETENSKVKKDLEEFLIFKKMNNIVVNFSPTERPTKKKRVKKKKDEGKGKLFVRTY